MSFPPKKPRKKAFVVAVQWTVTHFVTIEDYDQQDAEIKAMQVPLLIVGNDHIEPDGPTGETETIHIEE